MGLAGNKWAFYLIIASFHTVYLFITFLLMNANWIILLVNLTRFTFEILRLQLECWSIFNDARFGICFAITGVIFVYFIQLPIYEIFFRENQVSHCQVYNERLIVKIAANFFFLYSFQVLLYFNRLLKILKKELRERPSYHYYKFYGGSTIDFNIISSTLPLNHL